MPDILDTIKAQTQNLTQDERVDLAAYLLDSVDPDNASDPAWRAEIAQRVDDIRSGRVAGNPLYKVLIGLQGRVK